MRQWIESIAFFVLCLPNMHTIWYLRFSEELGHKFSNGRISHKQELRDECTCSTWSVVTAYTWVYGECYIKMYALWFLFFFLFSPSLIPSRCTSFHLPSVYVNVQAIYHCTTGPNTCEAYCKSLCIWRGNCMIKYFVDRIGLIPPIDHLCNQIYHLNLSQVPF